MSDYISPKIGDIWRDMITFPFTREYEISKICDDFVLAKNILTGSAATISFRDFEDESLQLIEAGEICVLCNDKVKDDYICDKCQHQE